MVASIISNKYTPEWAEKITEIPADTIRRLTKEFSDAAEKYKGAANCYRSRKSTWYYQDFEFRRAQAIFNALHGCVNRPGGVLLNRGLKAEKIPSSRADLNDVIYEGLFQY